MSELARCLESGVVDGLGELDVELASGGRVERHAKRLEGVGETLNSDTDGSVAHVAVASFLDGVVVDVDDLVQIAGDDLCCRSTTCSL